MKESDAKTKLCPMMLTNDRDTGHSLCEGSACMAFRWRKQPSDNQDSPIAEIGDGYCGLAGKP